MNTKPLNRIKRLETAVLLVIKTHAADLDPRWASIARTDIQKAFMSVERAFTQAPNDCEECGK